MTLKERIAFWGYLLSILPLFVFGVIYLARTEFMPYHSEAIGLSWNELSPGMQVLFIASLRLVGGCFMTLAASLFVLLMIPFRQQKRWAKLAIPGIALMGSSFITWAVYLVKTETPANPPIIIPFSTSVFIILIFLFSLGKR